MKTILHSIVILTCIIASTAVCDAACHSGTNTNQEIKVIVPFAVPVGVPVAAVAPYFYSYQQFQTRPEEPSGVVVKATAPARDSLPASRGLSSPLVAAHCATCHGGPSPKAGLSLESIDNLSDADRFKAIRAVASGRMPKGETVTADEVRAVIQQLANSPSASTD